MIKTVLFDMSETMLNLSLCKENFDKYFDDKYILKYWFTKLLHISIVVGVMNKCKNFGELGEVVLKSLFCENNKELKKTKIEILGAFRKLSYI